MKKEKNEKTKVSQKDKTAVLHNTYSMPIVQSHFPATDAYVHACKRAQDCFLLLLHIYQQPNHKLALFLNHLLKQNKTKKQPLLVLFTGLMKKKEANFNKLHFIPQLARESVSSQLHVFLQYQFAQLRKENHSFLPL